MTFLPVVGRELRVASRRRGSYWIRFAAAVAAVLLVGWVIVVSSEQPQGAGPAAFGVLSGLVFIYTAVAGVLATCDCLSEEKREGTLGLLFLTDLKGYDVVLGKLAATSLNALYGLLAVIPALTIPLLLGGVNYQAVWHVALVALNLLFFFLAVGLFASAICRQDNVALLVAAGVAVVLLTAVPMWFWVQAIRGARANPEPWICLSPGAGCFAAFADFGRTPGAESTFWMTAGATQVYGWIFFVAACLITPRAWQERSAGKGWREKWAFYSPGRKWRERQALLGNNPYLWRCARQPFKRGLVWLGLGLCVGGWLWLRRLFRDQDADAFTTLLLLGSLDFVLKCWIALEAPRALYEDRRHSGLELLLSTPLSAESILTGQRVALWRQFALPMGAVLAAHLWFWVNPRQTASMEDWHQALGVVAIMGISLVMDGLALSWWGMWLGLKGRRPNRAAMMSLALIVALPVLLFGIIDVAYEIHARGSGDTFWTPFSGWVALGLFADFFFMLLGQYYLRERFRELAANPSGARGGR